MRFFIILLIGLVSCTGTVTKDKQEAHVIRKVWRIRPLNIHQEMSPAYRALLSNGDTVPCSMIARVGDTVYYKYYKVKK